MCIESKFEDIDFDFCHPFRALCSDEAKRGDGGHLQVYRYLQAGGPIEHSLSQWQYRTPTTNQWTFQTSSNGWEKVAKQVSNCSKIHSILKINFYHQRCPYEAYFRLSVSGMPNDFWEFDMTLMKVSSNKNLEYVAHDYASEYYYSGAQAKF